VTTRTNGLGPILTVSFAGSLGYSIVMPFLVFLVTQWGGDAVVYSLVAVAYSAFQLVGAPLLGRWSDVVGRKRVLGVSQAGSALSWLVALAAFYVPVITLAQVDSRLLGSFTLTLPLVVLFVARALDGITGGNISVANAYVADISPASQRNANFGRLSASANVGAVLGPALAGLLVGTALGYELPVMVAAAVSFAAMLLIIFRLPDQKPTGAMPAPAALSSIDVCGGRRHERCALPRMKIGDMLRLPGVGLLLSASFLVNLAFNIFNVTLPVWAVKELSWSPGEMGMFFAVMSLVMVIVEGPGLRRLSQFCSARLLIGMGSLILALGFLALSSHATSVVFGGAVLIAVGNGLMWPLIVSLLSDKAGSHQGAVQGLAGSTGAIAAIIGLLLGGLLYAPLQGRLFVVAAAMIALVGILTLWSKRKSVSPDGRQD
jgi:DHA1 family tetracycline resistance protein-like MFS transporter